ncbi:MAG: metal-dependent hydrolase [Rhodoferax sp.]|nr:metal-dependent hydrolase [Rhodoferax sp.]
MDSVSQLALGASIGIAVMGRRTAVWKAALWGGIAGTLPDLDVLLDHGDAVLNMVLHRGHSHSLLWTSIAGALLGTCAARVHGQWPLWRRWSLAIWLAMATHPLLDAVTVYGTQVLQPFTDEAYGVGSIFVVDPLYTLPLLLGVVLALRRPVAYGLKWNLRLLALSTAYLAWSMVAQVWAQGQVQSALRTQGIQAQALLVTPAPLNTVLWRAVVVQGDQYLEGYYSLFDGGRPVRWTAHPRGSDLMQTQAHHPHVQRMMRFTAGMVRLRIENGNLWLTDLRMGQEGAYVFDFDLGPRLAPGQAPPAAVQHSERPPVRESLKWLWVRMWGADLPPMSATP